MSEHPGSAREVLRVALGLGLTSFGGPSAHVGYFHRTYVVRRRWVSEQTYADLLALSQFLPGPASSQLGIAIGMRRAGWAGAIAAWIGFTLPSAVLLLAFAYRAHSADVAGAGWMHGLKLAAVAVVAAAIWSMWRTLAPDLPRRAIAVAAGAAMILAATAALQVVVIAAGALVGAFLLSGVTGAQETDEQYVRSSRRVGAALLAILVLLLVVLPLLGHVTQSELVQLVERFVRVGSLVFGGGHVVLPLLSEAVVAPGWVASETFLVGYGAAQAVPGPLLSFAAFLGATMSIGPGGILGGMIALVAIFAPSFLLVAGVLPFWERLRRAPRMRAAMAGTNAAVIGLLIAALWDPIWTSSVDGLVDVVLVVIAWCALVLLDAAPWKVVAGLALAAELASRVS